MGEIEDALRHLIREIVREIVREEMPRQSPLEHGIEHDLLTDKTRSEINEYMRLSHKPYLSREEAAIYLGVSKRSIAEWVKRPMDQSPLPESCAGGEPRIRREAIDAWAEREQERKRLKLDG